MFITYFDFLKSVLFLRSSSIHAVTCTSNPSLPATLCHTPWNAFTTFYIITFQVTETQIVPILYTTNNAGVNLLSHDPSLASVGISLSYRLRRNLAGALGIHTHYWTMCHHIALKNDRVPVVAHQKQIRLGTMRLQV